MPPIDISKTVGTYWEKSRFCIKGKDMSINSLHREIKRYLTDKARIRKALSSSSSSIVKSHSSLYLFI